MTPLALEIIRILRAEDRAALSIETLQKVMTALGYSGSPLGYDVIERALGELMQAGVVEAVSSMKIGTRYRVMRVESGRDLSEPITATTEGNAA